MNAEIDTTIQQVERLYRSITGISPPTRESGHASIPPEVDAQKFVEEQLERLVGLVSHAPATIAPASVWAPPCLIMEQSRELIISFDLAGVPAGAVDVTCDNGQLIVSGQRRAPWTNGRSGARVQVCERPFGPFQRTIQLPTDAVVDDMAAELKDGVLEVRIPRTEDHGPRPARHINVK